MARKSKAKHLRRDREAGRTSNTRAAARIGVSLNEPESSAYRLEKAAIIQTLGRGAASCDSCHRPKPGARKRPVYSIMIIWRRFREAGEKCSPCRTCVLTGRRRHLNMPLLLKLAKHLSNRASRDTGFMRHRPSCSTRRGESIRGTFLANKGG